MPLLLLRHVLCLVLSCLPIFAIAQQDASAASDHSEFPRIAGSAILGSSVTDFGSSTILTPDDRGRAQESSSEGHWTRLVYVLEDGQSPLFAVRNYEEAFRSIGDVEMVWGCDSGKCSARIGPTILWSEGNRSDVGNGVVNTVLTNRSFINDQAYLSAVVETTDTQYTVGVYAATRADWAQNSGKADIPVGRTLVLVDIIEEAAFEAELEYVEAVEIQSEIESTGHIAIYGLFFDSGNDTLTAESAPALAEVAKVLDANSNLQIYVVGHTDLVGSLSSNQALSERRARSVANSLVTDFGIKEDRLIPLGAGPIAPVSTNDTEGGRALNRRVELVKR